MSTYVCVVLGTPAPQGSKTHVGNGRMIESSAGVRPWREAVKWAWRDIAGQAAPLDGPLCVRLAFTLKKPTSAPKRRRTWPAKKPDLDKLVRATLDGLTDAGAWHDDAQVVCLTASKHYPAEDPTALPHLGAVITIGPHADTCQTLAGVSEAAA